MEIFVWTSCLIEIMFDKCLTLWLIWFGKLRYVSYEEIFIVPCEVQSLFKFINHFQKICCFQNVCLFNFNVWLTEEH